MPLLSNCYQSQTSTSCIVKKLVDARLLECLSKLLKCFRKKESKNLSNYLSIIRKWQNVKDQQTLEKILWSITPRESSIPFLKTGKYTDTFQNSLWTTWTKGQKEHTSLSSEGQAVYGKPLQCASGPPHCEIRSLPVMARIWHATSCSVFNRKNKTVLANCSYAQNTLRSEFLKIVLIGLETWLSNIKSICCSCRKPGSTSQHQYNGSWAPIASAPWAPTRHTCEALL